MRSIDLNCDLGESYGNYSVGNDLGVFPFLSSCNIACGFHGGDPYQIELTIDRAIEHQVVIGAHPSYPDLMGFGRRKMSIPFPELSSLIKYQVSALKAMAESKGAYLAYVKPHGALYNSMAKNLEEARIVVQAIKAIDTKLKIMGLTNSLVESACQEASMEFIAEGFADRRYEATGNLVSRSIPNAVIRDPVQAASQVLDMVVKNQIETIDGKSYHLNPKSICIHGDTSTAVEILKAIHAELASHEIAIKSFA